MPRDYAARAKWTAPVELALVLPAGFVSLRSRKLERVKKSKGREIHTWSSERCKGCRHVLVVQPTVLEQA